MGFNNQVIDPPFTDIWDNSLLLGGAYLVYSVLDWNGEEDCPWPLPALRPSPEHSLDHTSQPWVEYEGQTSKA